MYLYLSNSESPDSFRVRIPGSVDITGEIGLSEIYFEFNSNIEFFDVCCDICESSVVESWEPYPVLRRIHALKRKEYIQFDPIYYIPVLKGKPYEIKIYLRSVQSNSPSVDLKSLSCTLHQKP